eukprot:scaffold38859_cov28-Tisochrysis_lutea.AAC.1
MAHGDEECTPLIARVQKAKGERVRIDREIRDFLSSSQSKPPKGEFVSPDDPLRASVANVTARPSIRHDALRVRVSVTPVTLCKGSAGGVSARGAPQKGKAGDQCRA